MVTRREHREHLKRLPWRERPRRTFLEAAPTSKLGQAMWAFPYICLGFVVVWALGGERPESLPLLVVFSVVAAVESVFLVLWLRRPLESSTRRNVWRPRRSPDSQRHR